MVDLSPLKGKRVLVLGGNGFLGDAVAGALLEVGANLFRESDDHCMVPDLMESFDVERMMTLSEPDYVVSCAGWNGGVGFSRESSFRIFSDNTAIPLNVLWAASKQKNKPKVLMPVASCAYPQLQAVKVAPKNDSEGIIFDWVAYEERQDCHESQLFSGPPHPSIEAHGYAKRNTQLACKFAREQFGLVAVTVCPPTLMGPRDRYDPDRSKIMAAMIRRFADAADRGDSEVVCWGSGKPLREYLYVKDAAQLLLQALIAYEDSSMPLNVGGGFEFSIKETAEMVAQACGYSGTIRWDETKPDGQFRKRLDTTRMQALLGPQSFTPMEEALRETVAAYRRDRDVGCLR